MRIASLTFVVVVLPILLLSYYLLPDKLRTGFLTVSSLLLYSWGSPWRVCYPLIYLCYDYGTGLLLEKYRKKRNFSTGILCISVMMQVSAMAHIRGVLQEENHFPFGIVFYTLQGLGYLIGIYWNRHKAERNFFKLGVYLLFFPSLFAGGLFSYTAFSSQKRKKNLNPIAFSKGISLFIRGLAEKVVLADTFEYIFRELQQISPEEMSMLTAWMITIIFSMYLYFELLGYSEMARGLGACFGYELPKNFSHPFFTPSMTAFMKNWNMTLVSWFETNFQKSLFRKNGKNIGFIFMWVLIGVWYGLKVQFLLWGLLAGILILNEKLFLEKIIQKNYFGGVIYTVLVSQFLWVLLFSENLTQTAGYWKAMLGFGNGIFDRTGIYFTVSYLALILIGFYIATDLFKNIAERMSASKFGQKLMVFMPVFHSVLLIFCIASMLYSEQSTHMWLWL
ncbi:MAG: hypothetical protein IKI37_08790 [Oscillospiraceae bacterium]|nr:hypothetical protein [Oscillospiraceae bacterium]